MIRIPTVEDIEDMTKAQAYEFMCPRYDADRAAVLFAGKSDTYVLKPAQSSPLYESGARSCRTWIIPREAVWTWHTTTDFIVAVLALGEGRSAAWLPNDFYLYAVSDWDASLGFADNMLRNCHSAVNKINLPMYSVRRASKYTLNALCKYWPVLYNAIAVDAAKRGLWPPKMAEPEDPWVNQLDAFVGQADRDTPPQ